MQITNAMMSNALGDDYGFWSDYGLYSADYTFAYTHVMTAAEIRHAVIGTGYVTGAKTADVAMPGKPPSRSRLPAAELTILSGNATGSKPYTATSPLG